MTIKNIHTNISSCFSWNFYCIVCLFICKPCVVLSYLLQFVANVVILCCKEFLTKLGWSWHVPGTRCTPTWVVASASIASESALSASSASSASSESSASAYAIVLEHRGLHTSAMFFIAYIHIVKWCGNFNCIVCLNVAVVCLLCKWCITAHKRANKWLLQKKDTNLLE